MEKGVWPQKEMRTMLERKNLIILTDPREESLARQAGPQRKLQVLIGWQTGTKENSKLEQRKFF